jgi:hypothetical protein
VLVRDVVKRLSSNGLALAFLDPEGFEVHFDTLAVLEAANRHRLPVPEWDRNQTGNAALPEDVR